MDGLKLAAKSITYLHSKLSKLKIEKSSLFHCTTRFQPDCVCKLENVHKTLRETN